MGPLGRQVGLDTVLERKKFVKVRRRPPSAAVLGRSWGRLGALLAALWLVFGAFPLPEGGRGGHFGSFFGGLEQERKKTHVLLILFVFY